LSAANGGRLRPLAFGWDVAGIAVEALSRYRLRTFLSVLGVVLGVAAVIAMMSVSEGARSEALAQVESLGLNNLVIRKSASSFNSTTHGLTADDGSRLLTLVPILANMSPLVDRWFHVSHDGRGRFTNVVGVTSSYRDILRLGVSHGRFLAATDDQSGARVCVLGHSLALELFGRPDVAGAFIRIDGHHWQVIGVLAARTSSPAIGAMAWRDLDTGVIAPLTALSSNSLRIAPSQPVDEIWLEATDGAQVELAGQLVARALPAMNAEEVSFELVIPRELLQQRFRTQRTFSVVVGSVAVLALLVGGIGIMNIMLTSVLERTREIGLRRTVGATRNAITAQFVLESLMMTLGGGILGILVGVVVAGVITTYAGWTTRVSLPSIALGFIVSLAVGLGFGIYPAVRAARLEPVDAIRYE
jgi:putative ABC transport system permease protein